jgi:hypothetical protein
LNIRLDPKAAVEGSSMGKEVQIFFFFSGGSFFGANRAVGGDSLSFAKAVHGVYIHDVKPYESLVPKVELWGLDLRPVALCRDVEDGRMAVNCFDLEEQLSRSTEKRIKHVWTHGGGEVRKKKLGFFRTWKTILVLIRSSLDQVSASRLRYFGLGLKPKFSLGVLAGCWILYNSE